MVLVSAASDVGLAERERVTPAYRSRAQSRAHALQAGLGSKFKLSPRRLQICHPSRYLDNRELSTFSLFIVPNEILS
jgi:hypothetical protein